MQGGRAVGGAGRDATSERVVWDGRVTTVSWLAPPFRPERRLTTQALGICFTTDGQIVLVSSDGENWSLPGGHPEPGETLEMALERELREETCARLVSCEYVGCQRVDDPDRRDGPALYYQARFWARVELYPFEASGDTIARRLVTPATFLDTLAWGEAAAARILLALGRRREQQLAQPASQD
jgi:ADP-ribose pyrophosphatase YjhB (NUDIX family)